MNNKKTMSYVIQLSIILFVVIALVSGGTFAYWQWASDSNKSVVFNTVSGGYEEFVEYDAGESHFVGDFKQTDSFCDGVSTTITVNKIKKESEDNIFEEMIDFSMTIMMDINEISESISGAEIPKVYWVVTRGNNTMACSLGLSGLEDVQVLSYGTFNGKSAGDEFQLNGKLGVEEFSFPVEITDTKTQYTVWIWVYDDTGLSEGDTVNTNVWSQINMLDKEEDIFGEAYAVYFDSDKSLRFYRAENENPIEVGSEIDGRIVTAVYSGIETLNQTSASQVPWSSKRNYIKEVVVENYVMPINTSYWFYNFRDCTKFDLSKLITSQVIKMNGMFYLAGSQGATDPSTFTGTLTDKFQIVGLNRFDTSNVTDMRVMFRATGSTSKEVDIGDISSWNTSNVTSMSAMFYDFAYNASKWNLNEFSLKVWNVSNVINMQQMFSRAGVNLTDFYLDLRDWDLSNVTNMSGMFSYLAEEVEGSFYLDLSNWKTGSLTNLNNTFADVGQYVKETFELKLIGWDVSNVLTMNSMLQGTGQHARIYRVIGLDDWDVSNVTDMSEVFMYAGRYSDSWDVGKLNDWNLEKATITNLMFYYAGQCAGAVAGVDKICIHADTLREDSDGDEILETDLSTTWTIGDIRKWKFPMLEVMSTMFAYAGQYSENWTIGNIETWDTSNVTNMGTMFAQSGINAQSGIGDLKKWNVCNVSVYTNFFPADGFLATVTPNFAKSGLCEGTVSSSIVGDAYAIYSADDNSLRFYRSTTAISAGSLYNGRIATKVYTNFELGDYTRTTTPWYEHVNDIRQVVFENNIIPRSTKHWFSSLIYCSYFDLGKLNTSNVLYMNNMFENARGTGAEELKIVGMNNWDTSNVTNMSYMFYNFGSSLDSSKIMIGEGNVDIKNLNTSNVTNMERMFYGSKLSLDLSGWNVCEVTNSSNFQNKGLITEPNWEMSCP